MLPTARMIMADGKLAYMEPIKEVSSCRLCGSRDIETVLDFGLSPLANAYKTKAQLDEAEFKAPIRYFKCAECNAVQLKDEVDPLNLFLNYDYESPPNLRANFSELTKKLFFFNRNDETVLDIGSNSGLLLSEVRNFGMPVQGVEPCFRLANKAIMNGIPTIKRFFDDVTLYMLIASGKTFGAIVSTNTFAHVPDLNYFVRNVKQLMTPSSVFIFENAYLLDTLNNNDLGQLYSEHVFLHSVGSLQKFFKKHGLSLFMVERIPVQMGSIRGFVCRDDGSYQGDGSVEAAIENETRSGIFDTISYSKFTKRVDETLNKLKTKLQTVGPTAIYGWPAKCSLIVEYTGIERYLEYVVEESSLKVGKYAPGTKLEIKSLDYFKENPTPNCLIGAYNFADDIIVKNDWYQGQWINPLCM